MIQYVEIPPNLNKLLDLISEFNDVSSYKVNM